MMSTAQEYYLEVVRAGDKPHWPRPEEELEVSSQPLGSGFIQYWAREKNQKGKDGDLPQAEQLARDHRTDKWAILIDQPTAEILILVAVKDGHAWAKLDSNLANLEANITSLVDFVSSRFSAALEHFLTTTRVAPAIERRLDELASMESGLDGTAPVAAEAEQAKIEETTIRPLYQIDHQPLPGKPDFFQSREGLVKPKAGSSSTKLWVFLPLVVILIIFLALMSGRERILAFLGRSQSAVLPLSTVIPTPVPTLIPTPTLVVKQGFKVRVLNGTTKTGAAAVLAEKLRQQGWEVAAVGNAKSQSFTQTQISTKKGTEPALLVMMADLKGEFEATAGSALDLTDKADVEVVIGRK